MTGVLFVVATPIGNLGDLSPRAVETLAGADLICCEDTRRCGRLLAHAGLSGRRLLRVDEHTTDSAVDEVERALAGGDDVALVSDAGTPGVSDPGQRLVRSIIEAGHRVSVVPGPSAAIAALVVSGLDSGRFVFEGFLPRKGSERSRRLRHLAADPRTFVVYESPRRLAATLSDLAQHCGAERPAVVARELTKLHEEVTRGSLADLVTWADAPVRGEVVIVVEGAPEPAEPSDDELGRALRQALQSGRSVRDATGEVADSFGVGRRRVYELALAAGKVDRGN